MKHRKWKGIRYSPQADPDPDPQTLNLKFKEA